MGWEVTQEGCKRYSIHFILGIRASIYSFLSLQLLLFVFLPLQGLFLSRGTLWPGFVQCDGLLLPSWRVPTQCLKASGECLVPLGPSPGLRVTQLVFYVFSMQADSRNTFPIPKPALVCVGLQALSTGQWLL